MGMETILQIKCNRVNHELSLEQRKTRKKILRVKSKQLSFIESPW